MKIKRKYLLRILDQSNKGKSLKQIRSSIGLSKTKTLKLKNLLEKMVKKGDIFRKGHFYNAKIKSEKIN